MKRTGLLFRIKFLYIGFFMVSFVLIAQLYIVQIVKGKEYNQQADRQYVQYQDTFSRGNIFFEDKNGKRISAGTTQSGFKLAINPDILENPEEAYRQLSKFIDIDEDIFLYRANKENDPYEEIANRINIKEASEIQDLNIKGVSLFKDAWRFYPGNKLASNVLGFVGYNEDSLEGIYGIENYYEHILRRESKNLFINFFAEIFSNLNKVIRGGDGKKEGNIILTIEPSVQSYLEIKLKELSDEWKTSLAGGIIINPQNGEIYGLGVYPDFNPNNFRNESGPFGNPLVENVYEMGSIMKAVTMAIGLDTGAVTAETTYNDKGSLMLDGRVISNYDGKARGVVGMQEVLNQSLNVGAVFVASEIGNKTFTEYLFKLGVEEETGVDLPNETYGLISSNLKKLRDIECATASYGQGIAITPIETVKAFSALANGGLLITPHLAKEIKYGIGSSDKIFYDNKRVFKEETSKEITRMLVEVVDDALLGGTVRSENYTIAAKTGTAQMAKETEKGYYDDKYLHSFFGYFPTSAPRFLVFLYILDPQGVEYASRSLTYPFMDIFKFLVNYYEISTDRDQVETF